MITPDIKEDDIVERDAAPVDATAPVVQIVDLDPDGHGCTRSTACARYVTNSRTRLVGRFLGDGAPTPEQIVAASIDLRELEYVNYIAACKRRYKGGVVRDAHKSERAGFFCQPFPRALYVPDIVTINHSKDERCGKPMRATYLRGIEAMGGAPRAPVTLEPPACPVHYDRWWGIFAPEPGYRQGDVVTDARLLAYIDFRRVGTLALYSLILGHGEYLQHGIMYRLHFAVMEWLLAREEAAVRGIEQLMYAGYYQGGKGLQLWKKKTLFEPTLLVARSARTAAPAVPSVSTRVSRMLRRLLRGD